MTDQSHRPDGYGLSREQIMEHIRELNTIAANCEVEGTAEFSRSAHNLYHIAKQWFKSLPTSDGAAGTGTIAPEDDGGWNENYLFLSTTPIPPVDASREAFYTIIKKYLRP